MKTPRFRSLALALALAAAGTAALAQPPQHRGRMTHEDRQRLRDEINSARDVYTERAPRDQEARQREFNRRGEDTRGGRLSPEERERLRRDIDDTNRDLQRRRR